jgi:hypothetical protein
MQIVIFSTPTNRENASDFHPQLAIGTPLFHVEFWCPSCASRMIFRNYAKRPIRDGSGVF